MVPWLMNALMHAGRAAARHFEDRSAPAQSGQLNTRWFVVDPSRVREFEADHPDALNPEFFIVALRRRGSHDMAEEARVLLAKYERQNPGFDIYVKVCH